METAAPVGSFPSPYEVGTPPGCEGWEELYPYYALFDEDRREADEQRRGFEGRRAQLEVGRASERQRPGAEERPAQVRGAAAPAPDDPPGRVLERCVAPVDDACRDQHGERLGLAGDVQLVPRRRVECPPPVRADLRADAAFPQEGEATASGGTAAEIEV